LQTVAKGGIDLDLGLHVHYYDYGKVFPKSPSGLKVSISELNWPPAVVVLMISAAGVCRVLVFPDDFWSSVSEIECSKKTGILVKCWRYAKEYA